MAVAAAIADVVLAERERWALWLPVAIGGGIGIYFALPFEPPAAIGAGAAAGLLAGLLLLRRRPAAGLALAALLAVALGFAAAQLRAGRVEAPILARETGPVLVTGRVAAVEDLAAGRRLLLEDLAIAGLPEGQALPARVRLRLKRGDAQPLGPGDRIALRAMLRPPPAPAAPGAYDFQRHAYFERLGGVGYAIGDARRLEAGAGGGAPGLWIAGLRQALSSRMTEALGGPEGAIAAALFTGARSAIPEAELAALRDAGLAHILSISGLHISIVAGLFFVGLRAALAAVEPLALRFAIKKWAALGALAGTFGYVLLTGAPVPTQRAFLMGGLVLAAMLLDRRAISLRLVAWAAALILLTQPESLLGPSFQLSFAAVVALIAAYEANRERLAAWRVGAGLLGRGGLYLASTALTTLVAGAATAPYGIYHFNRFAAYGLVANLIAIPLTAFWIMPLGILVFALLPFGLEGAALAAAGWGIAAMIAVAERVAGWPGAAPGLPVLPLWGILLVTFGGLWLCLWQRPWRWWGAVGLIAGLAAIPLHRPPDILVAADGGLTALRAADGRLLLSGGQAGGLQRDIWLRRFGQGEALTFPLNGEAADGALRCDPLGCLFRAADRRIVLPRQPQALAEDCVGADLVISPHRVPPRACPGVLVIDRAALRRGGAHAIWLEREGIRIVSDRAWRGERPWVPPPDLRPGPGRRAQ